MEPSNHSILKIYASTTDKFGSKPFYEHIVYTAKEQGIAGVTVSRGIMGYGATSAVSSSRFWELTDKLPVMIEIIDKSEAIENFYKLIEPDLLKMTKGCLVSIEPITIKMQKIGKALK